MRRNTQLLASIPFSVTHEIELYFACSVTPVEIKPPPAPAPASEPPKKAAVSKRAPVQQQAASPLPPISGRSSVVPGAEGSSSALSASMSTRLAAVLYAPGCPLNTTHHYPLGSVVIYKTGVGAYWAPAVVFRAHYGLLYLLDLNQLAAAGGNLNSVATEQLKSFQPTSPHIYPVGLYSDEVHVNLGIAIMYSTVQTVLVLYSDFRKILSLRYELVLNLSCT